MAENIYDTEYVKGLFNRMSNSYERMNYITSFGFSIRWRSQFLQHLEATKEKVEIIDLLTGMGETWYAVKKRFPNANLTALDFSGEMIKRAKIKNAKLYQNKVFLKQQDVLKNVLESEKYDFVICCFGLKTFDSEQLKTLATETKRILKNGGQFSFIEVSKPDNWLLKVFYQIHLSIIFLTEKSIKVGYCSATQANTKCFGLILLNLGMFEQLPKFLEMRDSKCGNTPIFMVVPQVLAEKIVKMV